MLARTSQDHKQQALLLLVKAVYFRHWWGHLPDQMGYTSQRLWSRLLGELVAKLKNYGLTGGSNGLDAPVLKTLVLVATRELCDEELLLNYRLTNSKRRPDWYC
uniref:Uncharacterized protein n=1 Tax=Brassica oleracea TaxID=3712 RepID=A0A3P6D7Q9_BRAOL|nr:unnamed protein product [Brassica oleracea]